MHHSIKITIAVAFALSDSSLGQNVNDAYLPTRSTGMGGAFTAIAQDEGSIWTNPGGFSRTRKARSRNRIHILTLPNFTVGFNASGKELLNAFQSQSNAQSLGENISEATENETNISEKPLWVRASVNPSLFLEAGSDTVASISLMSHTTTKVVIDKSNPDVARVTTISDLGATTGIGWSNKTNRLNLGIQIRPTQRFSFDDKLPITTITDRNAMKEAIENSSNSGVGLGVDVGAMYTVADFWFPTIGVAVRNLPTGCQDDYLNPYDERRHSVCGTTYSGSINNPEALSTVDPTDLRIGVSITPRIEKKLALRLALDVQSLALTDGQNQYGLPGMSPAKQIHGGLELFFGNPLLIPPLSLRVGYGYGFITSGFSIRLPAFHLAFTSYGEDVSQTKSPKEDRRYLATISFEL